MSSRTIVLSVALAGVLLGTGSCNQISGVDFGAVTLRTDEAGTTPIDSATRGCGACPDGRRCESGKCACMPKTCPELGRECGIVDDGCGRALDCAGCANPDHACADGVCKCQPKTCQGLGAECGTVPNGCGDALDCSAGASCPPEKKYCGGGGPNKCGATPCIPTTCAAQGKNCGQISDGCGSILDCQPGCASPDTCGGNGVANVCGCKAKTCAQLGKSCGTVQDGCGHPIDCGSCSAPQTCGGGGTTNACGCTSDGSCSSCCGAGTDNCGSPCRIDTCCGGSTSTSSGGGGGGCFAAGTKITMADGTTKAIEDVIAGDRVLAFEPGTGRTEPATVLSAFHHGVETSSDGFVVVRGRLRVTPNHPLFVDGRIVPAGSLLDTARSPGGEPTYDLRVDGSGLYFADGIVVANKPPISD